jgi:hypothetical protein
MAGYKPAYQETTVKRGSSTFSGLFFAGRHSMTEKVLDLQLCQFSIRDGPAGSEPANGGSASSYPIP